MNTGAREGSETVHVYVGPSSHGATNRPLKKLKGYAKVHLAPGVTQSDSIALDGESFAYFDESKDKWSVDSGKYDIPVGVPSAHIVTMKDVDISAPFEFGP